MYNAKLVVDAGVDAVGRGFMKKSPRFVSSMLQQRSASLFQHLLAVALFKNDTEQTMVIEC
jgi:phosphoribosylanthranilate isomerase